MFSNWFQARPQRLKGLKAGQFFIAARTGYLPAIDQYIKENQDNHDALNVTDENNRTALMIAIEARQLEVVDKLANNPNMNINAVSGDGSALHLAIRHAPKAIDILMRNKIDLTSRDSKGNTIFMLFSNIHLLANVVPFSNFLALIKFAPIYCDYSKNEPRLLIQQLQRQGCLLTAEYINSIFIHHLATIQENSYLSSYFLPPDVIKMILMLSTERPSLKEIENEILLMSRFHATARRLGEKSALTRDLAEIDIKARVSRLPHCVNYFTPPNDQLPNGAETLVHACIEYDHEYQSPYCDDNFYAHILQGFDFKTHALSAIKLARDRNKKIWCDVILLEILHKKLFSLYEELLVEYNPTRYLFNSFPDNSYLSGKALIDVISEWFDLKFFILTHQKHKFSLVNSDLSASKAAIAVARRAVHAEDEIALKYLLQHTSAVLDYKYHHTSGSMNLLHFAASCKSYPIFEKIFQARPYFSRECDMSGDTPLFRIASAHNGLSDSEIRMVDLLISYDIYLINHYNPVTQKHCDMLTRSIERGNLALFEYLIRKIDLADYCWRMALKNAYCHDEAKIILEEAFEVQLTKLDPAKTEDVEESIAIYNNLKACTNTHDDIDFLESKIEEFRARLKNKPATLTAPTTATSTTATTATIATTATSATTLTSVAAAMYPSTPTRSDIRTNALQAAQKRIAYG